MTKGKIRNIYRRARGRSRAGKGAFPIMGGVTVATLGANMLAGGNPDYGNLSPIDSLQQYGIAAFGKNVASKLSQVGTYTPAVIPLAIWIGGRLFVGKGRLTKRISVF